MGKFWKGELEGLFLSKSVTQTFKLLTLKSRGINVYNNNNKNNTNYNNNNNLILILMNT